jgi:hypothetical protein
MYVKSVHVLVLDTYVYHNARVKHVKKLHTIINTDCTVLYKLYQTSLSTHSLKLAGNTISQDSRTNF